jgi:drug/metabolite transporter (DMT)-like permease
MPTRGDETAQSQGSGRVVSYEGRASDSRRAPRQKAGRPAASHRAYKDAEDGAPSASVLPGRPISTLPAVPRPLVWTLYACLVLIWSSTWVAIKIGLEDMPPLLSAGIRFAIAGGGLLALARALGRPLKTDVRLATVMAFLPFGAAYGLIYWGEQYVPSGLAAVLFGMMPLYSATIAAVALADEPLHARLLAGIAVAIGGLALAFGESLALGDAKWALLAASACALAPLASAIGNVAIKRRGQQLDPIALNGWAMLGGGALLLIASAPAEDWGSAAWTNQAVGSIAYLAAIGSAVPFVTLTILLRELRAVTVSYITLLLPFGALVFGAALYDERITVAALGGAALVAAGLAVTAPRPGRGALRGGPKPSRSAVRPP